MKTWQYNTTITINNRKYDLRYDIKDRQVTYKFDGACYRININPLTPMDDILKSIKGLG